MNLILGAPFMTFHRHEWGPDVELAHHRQRHPLCHVDRRVVGPSGRFSNFPWFGKPFRLIFDVLLSLSATIVAGNPLMRWYDPKFLRSRIIGNFSYLPQTDPLPGVACGRSRTICGGRSWLGTGDGDAGAWGRDLAGQNGFGCRSHLAGGAGLQEEDRA